MSTARSGHTGLCPDIAKIMADTDWRPEGDIYGALTGLADWWQYHRSAAQ